MKGEVYSKREDDAVVGVSTGNQKGGKGGNQGRGGSKPRRRK